MKLKVIWALVAVCFTLAMLPAFAMPRDMVLQAAAVTTPTGQAIGAQWTNPDHYIDGSALPVTDIIQTRIEYGSCVGAGNLLVFGAKAGQWISPGGATHANSPTLPSGTYCIQAFTTAKGIESSATNVVQVILVAPQAAPNPPSNLTGTAVAQVASNTTAFSSIKSADNLALLPIGTVLAGTLCDPTQGVLKAGVLYNLVPTAFVTQTGTVKPIAAFAQCS